MKELMCITSNQYDRDQYKGHKELYDFYHSIHCNGLELLLLEDTSLDEILMPDDITGIHLPFVNCWVDFWKGNTLRLYEEYESDEWICHFFGGLTKDAFTEKLRKAVIHASVYQPEYLVFHVSECTAYESVSNLYHYSDEEVIDAAIEYINTWCDTITKYHKNKPWLLLENLWHSGLNLQKPQLINRLISEIHYPKTGILLDTGHLCHCNPNISSSDEAVDYIHHILDTLDDISVIQGIHLHHTLSGKRILEARKSLPSTGMTLKEKFSYYYPLVYQIDAHQPFTSTRIHEIIDRIHPQYLVYEILTSTKEEYAGQLSICGQWGR